MKKTKGKIRWIIFGKLRIVYDKYTLNPWPSSVTKSKKLTAWMTQTIAEIEKHVVRKNLNVSFVKFWNNNFFIEIY